MKSFKGISVSKGIKIGKAYRYSKTKLIVESYQIDSSEVEAELERLSRAKSRANDYLNNIKEKAAQELGSKETQIFDAHIYMLNDPVLNQEIREIIKNDKINAESAVDKAISKVSDKFMVLNDEYFKERIKDVQDVGNHLIRALTGELMTLHNIPVNSIIIAEDLTPSETTLLDKERLEGFVLEKGGETSHTAIMAKSLMLPAVINAEDILDEVKQGETIILDAVKGEVFVNPEQDIVSYYQEKIKKYHREQQSLLELREKPARTKDGKIVEIAGNIASEKELSTAKEVNADGIGLFRTEFLYMNKANLTDEERQFKIYKKVLKQMSPKPVVIRTLDIGGDKDLPYFRGPEEVNPFLGWRGIRILLEKEDIFRAQLRAMLRASIYGNLKLLLPLISSLEELNKVKKTIETVKRELLEQGIAFADNIEIGIMIEVPSTAVMADVFAEEVDFFSIGTNDLIQYTLAVDRNNNKIASLYTPYHPAVLRLIQQVTEAAASSGKWVAVCGEAAGNPLLVPLFVALGIRELSMSSSSILEIKKIIRKINKKDAAKILNNIKNYRTATEVENYLELHYQKLIEE